jgi:hypothetical protein
MNNASANKQTTSAGAEAKVGNAFSGLDDSDHRGSTQAAAAQELRHLLSGEEPSDAPPGAFGEWQHHIQALRDAYAAGGAEAVRAAFDAMARQEPALAELLAAGANPAASTLDDIIATFQRWLYLPDPAPLLAVLAAVLANYGPGDPVWLLLVAPPSSGKTEILHALASLPRIHAVGVLTEASLLSGTPRKERAKDAQGGLMRAIGDHGILVVKDFGGILSINKNDRGPLVAALREIYDGHWVRLVGSDGGRTLEWRGKCGLIGGATPAIDEHHAVMSTLGERFVFFRMDETNEHEVTKRALTAAGHEQAMRQELATAVAALFQSIPQIEVAKLSDDEEDSLIALASFTTRCRSAVTRDPYSREIILIPGAEAPSRLAKVLLLLLSALEALGVARAEAWLLVERVAFDSMPRIRWQALKTMLNDPSKRWSTSELASLLGYPSTTTRRALEDLAAYRVLQRYAEGPGHADQWGPTDWAVETYLAATNLSRNSSNSIYPSP